MKVGVHSLVRQRWELVARPTCRWSLRAAEEEVTGRDRRPRRGTGREHGEVGGLVLAGGEPGGCCPGSWAATKSSGDKWFGHGLANASFLTLRRSMFLQSRTRRKPQTSWQIFSIARRIQGAVRIRSSADSLTVPLT